MNVEILIDGVLAGIHYLCIGVVVVCVLALLAGAICALV